MLFLFFNVPMIKCGSQAIQYSTAQTPLPSTPENKAADNDYKGIVEIMRTQRDQQKIFTTTDTILRNLGGNPHPYLMKAGIHQLEVLPSTRKQREKTRKERPFKSWLKLLPFPSTWRRSLPSHLLCILYKLSFCLLHFSSLCSKKNQQKEAEDKFPNAFRYEEAREIEKKKGTIST